MYQLRRFMTGLLLLLVCMVLVASCSQKKPVSHVVPAIPEAAPEAMTEAVTNDFKVKLVFDGLTSYQTSDTSNTPDQSLFFMGPLHPKDLQIAKKMPPHVGQLFIKGSGNEEITALDGRALTTVPNFSHGLTTINGPLTVTNLSGEDITLKVTGTISPALTLGDMSGVSHLPPALAQLPGTPQQKSFRACLTGPDVTCDDLKTQLSGRVTLKNGVLSATDFITDDSGRVGKFVLALLNPQAIATSVTAAHPVSKSISADFDVKESSLEIHFRSLTDGKDAGGVRVQGHSGRTVEVHFVNHPICRDVTDCKQKGFTDSDFLFHYALLNNPQLNQGNLPIPKSAELASGNAVGPGVFNVQCSPADQTR